MKAINPIDEEILEGTKDLPVELDDEDEDAYPTLSSPFKYFAFLALFVVLPVGAYVYFYRGGREKLRQRINDWGAPYERLPTTSAAAGSPMSSV